MRWMASAMVRAWVSDSMTQGPAMRKSWPRPTGTLPMSNGLVTDLFDHSVERDGQGGEIVVDVSFDLL